jgi:Fe-S-cluster-containing hydrogenase component 2
VPRIKIESDKCTGCRLCEMACSLQHIENTFNPKRSRIRVFTMGDHCYPVIAGPYTEAECTAKTDVIIDGHEYDGCIACRASCPAKTIFKEPDVDIPLKCDFCGEPPDPQCVKICPSSCLTLLED